MIRLLPLARCLKLPWIEKAGTGHNIQVGAHDTESISINLTKINPETLGLKDFNVTKAFPNDLKSVPEGGVALQGVADISVADLQAGAAVSSVGRADDGKWYAFVEGYNAASDDGYFEIEVDESTGRISAITLDAANVAATAAGYTATTETP